MQKRQPIHLLARQMTGPSLVFSMAFVRQAAVQAGWLQCMHCFLTNTSPASVLNRFTTVYADGDVFLVSSKTASLVPGFGRPCSLAHASSHCLQPIQRVVSVTAPTNSGVVSNSFAASFLGSDAAPTSPRTLMKFLLSIRNSL